MADDWVGTLGRVSAWMIGIPVGIFIIMFLYFLINPDKTPLNERMRRECEREFTGRGEIIINECVLRLMTRYLAEREREKLDSAYGRAR